MKVCSIESCTSLVSCRGWCEKHYQRWRKHGDPIFLKIAPRGSGSKTKQGYIDHYVPNHPNANGQGRILEHRLVMSKILGRPLVDDEEVHHKNGVRDDNRPENLELWSKSQPAGQRVSDLIEWAHEILERYENA